MKREAEEKEGEESGSRPNSKQKGAKPGKKTAAKKPAKGKKGKGEEEEEKEEVYPIVNLDYASYRSNSMPTLSAFHDYYRLCKEKVMTTFSSNSI